MHPSPVDFRTSDLDEFREAVAGLFCPFSLTARAKHYDARLRHRRLGSLTFSLIAYDNSIDIEVPPLLPIYMVQVPLRGSFQARTTGPTRIISGERAHFTVPQVPLKIRNSGATDFLVTSIDPSEFLNTCALDDEDSRLLKKLPETLLLTGTGASLAHCIRFLYTEAVHAKTQLGGEKASRHAEQLLFSLLLDFSQEKSRFLVRGRSWYIKRAEEFMEANLDGDIGIADVAATASVSMRALQYGFRDVYGVSPMMWLKQRRLDRIHAELLRANPAETTVTDVALRWGFVHLGRFASDYRARFGELPSVTLHRR